MSAHTHYVGGKGKKPLIRAPQPEHFLLTCECGRTHSLQVLPNSSMAIIPCACGALIKWFQNGVTSIETIEKETE